MELANPIFNNALTRLLRQQDGAALTRFLRHARYYHVHVDWYALTDWLDQPAAVGLEVAGTLAAFLVAGADPAPAAWVRGVALDDDRALAAVLERLLGEVVPALRHTRTTELAWMSARRWPDRVVADLGFETVTYVVTMLRDTRDMPRFRLNPTIHIRPVAPGDMDRLAEIEAASFAPIWRYSARALQRASAQAYSFDTALIDDEIVGYQCSTANYYGAHLARMTVDPAVQRSGVGTALLANAIAGYRRGSLRQWSLNTQTDNVASHYLYRKFGYQQTSEKLPVWTLPISYRKLKVR